MAEVPQGDNCPYCQKKLTKTGERLSFGRVRLPVRDWFAWNHALRVILPAVLLVAAVALAAEAAFHGESGVRTLFLQGFLTMLAVVTGLLLLAMLLVLVLQGRESIHYVLDRQGVHAYTYLHHPNTFRLFIRFLTWEAVEAIQKDELALEGYWLVKRVEIPWSEIKRVRSWRENNCLLFFRPGWWQVLAMKCPSREYGDAEAFVMQKVGKRKGRKRSHT